MLLKSNSKCLQNITGSCVFRTKQDGNKNINKEHLKYILQKLLDTKDNMEIELRGNGGWNGCNQIKALTGRDVHSQHKSVDNNIYSARLFLTYFVNKVIS